jgi:hypothetical protein
MSVAVETLLFEFVVAVALPTALAAIPIYVLHRSRDLAWPSVVLALYWVAIVRMFPLSVMLPQGLLVTLVTLACTVRVLRRLREPFGPPATGPASLAVTSRAARLYR